MSAASGRPLRRAAGAAALGLAALLARPETASAYCQTTSCENDVIGSRCVPERPEDCGILIFWPTQCVGYSVQRDASSQVDLETTRGIVAQAFSAWENAACEGGKPSIKAQDLGPVTCDQVEYDGEKKNANIVVFRDSDWPYGTSAALALTTVTFSLESGEIRDADIEVNSADATLTTGDSGVEVDLLSILTHEAGHFLGLAHAPLNTATMNSDYPPGSTTLRSLDPDDEAGVCAMYPAGAVGTCNPTPKNGLGDACAEPAEVVEEDGCSAAAQPLSRGGQPGLCALLGALGALRLRRRPQRKLG